MQHAVTLIGHLTHDPSFKEFPTGTKLARFRIGASRRVRQVVTPSGDGGRGSYEGDIQYVERDQLYIDIECWGNLAENVYESLEKGKPVICVGYLTTQEWNDSVTGQKNSKVVLRAGYVGFDMRNYVVAYKRNPLPPPNGYKGANLDRFSPDCAVGTGGTARGDEAEPNEVSFSDVTSITEYAEHGDGIRYESSRNQVQPQQPQELVAQGASEPAPPF